MSNLRQVPEKSDKICTRYVGDLILKFLSPTEKITPICEWFFATLHSADCSAGLLKLVNSSLLGLKGGGENLIFFYYGELIFERIVGFQ